MESKEVKSSDISLEKKIQETKLALQQLYIEQIQKRVIPILAQLNNFTNSPCLEWLRKHADKIHCFFDSAERDLSEQGYEYYIELRVGPYLCIQQSSTDSDVHITEPERKWNFNRQVMTDAIQKRHKLSDEARFAWINLVTTHHSWTEKDWEELKAHQLDPFLLLFMRTLDAISHFIENGSEFPPDMRSLACDCLTHFKDSEGFCFPCAGVHPDPSRRVDWNEKINPSSSALHDVQNKRKKVT